MLVRWYPFSGLRRWDRYHFNPSYWPAWEGNYGVRHFHPRADLVESEEDYKVLLELPGLNKDDFNISLSEGLLTVSGEKKVESGKEKDHTYRLFERYSGDFHRSFELPEDVNEKGIEADYNNGVLTVRLPRSKKAKPREIPIKVSK
jgi:HSP20 family protein